VVKLAERRLLDEGFAIPRAGERHVDDVDDRRVGRHAHDDDAVSEGDGLVDAVRHHEDGLGRRLVLPQVDELVLQAGAGERVQRAERLVKQQYAGTDRERPGDGRALLHAAGHLRGSLVLVLPQADRGEIALDDLVGYRPVAAGHRRPGRLANVGQKAEPGEQRVVLEHHRPIRPGTGHHLVIGHDAAAVGLGEAGDDVDQRRLAAPRVPDERDELALLDGEVDAAKDLLIAVGLGDPFD
jgi:hypothetical protein